MNLKKSYIWSAIEHVGPQVVNLALSIILARLLDPSAYGVIGLTVLFTMLVSTFMDGGLSTALIQKKDICEDDRTSVFLMNIVFSFFLGLLLIVVSPWIAEFYKQSILISILKEQAMILFIGSFGIVHGVLLGRNSQFKQLAFIGCIVSFIQGVCGVLFAYFGYGVWSLIHSALIGTCLRVMLYWHLSHWCPHGRFRFSSIRSILKFSLNILGCKLMVDIYQNLYSVIIGRFFSVTELGYYDKASSLRMLPVRVMTGMVNRVTYPLFSRLQDDKIALLTGLRITIRGTMFFSAGGLILLALIADPLIPLLLTEKWNPSVPFLRIFSVGGILIPVSAIYFMVLQAQGFSNLNFRLEFIRMVLGCFSIFIALPFGVIGLAWTTVALAIASYFLNAWYNVKILEYSWRLQAVDIVPILGTCACAALCAIIFSFFLTHTICVLCEKIIVYGIVILASIVIFRKSYFSDIWNQIKKNVHWIENIHGL
jgi:O-antigen/teichoic acid export membrane protein